ncbi:hypothetical protein LGK97_18935 [Clostridium sp. CS001]|nr:hypothetical protein [Clostridium sp. CS001]MCB2291791.1 hypothetical protein [Clostridium sp. CS001]
MNKEDAYELGSVIATMVEGGIIYSLVKKSGKPLRLIAKQISKLINI